MMALSLDFGAGDVIPFVVASLAAVPTRKGGPLTLHHGRWVVLAAAHRCRLSPCPCLFAPDPFLHALSVSRPCSDVVTGSLSVIRATARASRALSASGYEAEVDMWLESLATQGCVCAARPPETLQTGAQRIS